MAAPLTNDELRAYHKAGHALAELVEGKWVLVFIGGPKNGAKIREFEDRDECKSFCDEHGIQARVREGIQYL